MPSVPPIREEELRQVALLADLTSDELAWIAERCDVVELEPGELLSDAAAPADWMYLTLRGAQQSRRPARGSDVPVWTFQAGDVWGRIPFSRMTHFAVTVHALTASRVARYPAAQLDALVHRFPRLQGRWVAHLTDRVREASRRVLQHEKLTALGQLAAGLAHELNNPAAAAQRAAAELRRRFEEHQQHTARLVAAGVSPALLHALEADVCATLQRAEPLADPVARSDCQDAVGSWLADAGLDAAWSAAATFVELGLVPSQLARLVEPVPPPVRGAALAWMESRLAAEQLLDESARATARMSSLVDVVKQYTQMGRPTALEMADVREGLATTLALLEERARERGVRLVRELDGVLPAVPLYAGELNQVWHAVVENALDAATSGGCVTVRARLARGGVQVEVEDDGPGIPPALQDRIWEPFFTTKEVGTGSGLGLDLARRVVTMRHGGEIGVASRPGATCFTIWLPTRESASELPLEGVLTTPGDAAVHRPPARDGAPPAAAVASSTSRSPAAAQAAPLAS